MKAGATGCKYERSEEKDWAIKTRWNVPDSNNDFNE